jgi:hypothetical protein
MSNNTQFRKLWFTFPLVIAFGCATHHSVTPTSDRGASRVYAATNGIITPAMPPPTGVDASQWQLSEEIRGMLMSDKTLAPYPSEVTVVVDKNTKGLVHLQGNVSNTYERRKLRARIEQLPGVTQVDDQTVVGRQMPSGTVDLAAPVTR